MVGWWRAAVLQSRVQRAVFGERSARLARVAPVLEVSRITRGKIELRRERLDLKEIVQSAVETSRPLIDAGSHELSIKTSYRPRYVDADPHD